MSMAVGSIQEGGERTLKGRNTRKQSWWVQHAHACEHGEGERGCIQILQLQPYFCLITDGNQSELKQGVSGTMDKTATALFEF